MLPAITQQTRSTGECRVTGLQPARRLTAQPSSSAYVTPSTTIAQAASARQEGRGVVRLQMRRRAPCPCRPRSCRHRQARHIKPPLSFRVAPFHSASSASKTSCALRRQECHHAVIRSPVICLGEPLKPLAIEAVPLFSSSSSLRPCRSYRPVSSCRCWPHGRNRYNKGARAGSLFESTPSPGLPRPLQFFIFLPDALHSACSSAQARHQHGRTECRAPHRIRFVRSPPRRL